MNYTKQQVLEGYNQFIKVLNNSKSELQRISGNDDDVKKIKKAVIKTVENEIDSALDFAEKTLYNQNWDHLTIGFFGITNAGKSTIVETFRILFDNNRVKNNDGMIVGDGSPDFTTRYDEYKFFIDGTEFTLIDVPGIEGDENSVKDNIFKGLTKAHIIFYVHGHDAAPDAKIVEKIKKYIGKGVNVYSVYNIKGGTGNYDEPEERVTLLDERTLKGANLVEETFRNTLGDTYKGNICVQALLSMTAYATFNAQRKDLIKAQSKLLSYFGSADNVLSFSHFKDLVDVVKEKAQNAKSEIIESNAKKLIQQMRQAYRSLSNVSVGSDEKFKVYKQNVNIIFRGALVNIKNRCEQTITNQFVWFENEVCKKIDDGEDNFDVLQNKLKSAIDDSLQDNIKSEVESLKNKIEKENQKLAEAFSYNYDDNVHISVDSSDASDVDYDFGDFGLDALTIGGWIATGVGIGTFFPGLGNLIGGIVGGIIGLLVAIFGNSENRKAKAKSEA
ncbi:MAG: 50S ribosome-binding GTPase, partial [Bacteroidales bacterium]|nr:50S ribosome-binding GTPase [Bacteroidales bacterium]